MTFYEFGGDFTDPRSRIFLRADAEYFVVTDIHVGCLVLIVSQGVTDGKTHRLLRELGQGICIGRYADAPKKVSECRRHLANCSEMIIKNSCLQILVEAPGEK